MRPQAFSIGEAIGFGWTTAKANIGYFVIVALIVVIVSGLLQALSKSGAGFLAFTAWIANFVVGQLFGVGATRISLRFADGGKPEVAELWSGLPLLVPYLVTSILYGLMVAVGLILFIVPGVILAIRYAPATYLVVDRGMAPLEALRKSPSLTDGVKWAIFVLGLALLGINVLGALALGIALFWTFPASLVATARVYRILLARAEGQAPATTAAPQPA